MKNYALITGASAGLGTEFAKQLADKGYKLILTARREDRLKNLAESLPVECVIIPADLSKKEECLRIFELIKDYKIDIFINNAGFGDCSSFLESDLDMELDMVDVNIKAMHILCKKMLRKMHKENRGYILNVASSAAFQAGPLMATYYASKAYVLRLSEAIYEELRQIKSNIGISVLCPGPVDTEFNKIAKVNFAVKAMDSRTVAEYAIKQMFKKKLIIIPGTTMKLCYYGMKFIPRKALLRVDYKIQTKKEG